jgi:RNA polymerase sigma-70 factor (ECF subfamily)
MMPEHAVTRFPVDRAGDVPLVEATARGDRAAMAELWDRYADFVRGVLHGANGPNGAIEDLTQKVFLAFVKSAATVATGAKLRGFLARVAVRLAALENRRRRVRRWLVLSPAGELPERAAAAHAAAGEEILAALERVLAGLSRRRRMAFVLRHVQEMEVPEVAAALDLSQSTLSRELQRVRDCLLRASAREPALAAYLASRCRTNADPKRDDAIEHLAELDGSRALAATTHVQRHLSRQRFLARVELEGGASRFSVWRWAVPALAAVCSAAALLLFFRTPALTFEVRGTELGGRYVSATETHPAELRFSDDSILVAAPGSRLRVEDINPYGARVLIERGQISVHVTRESSTAWTFGAGPFEVRVTGTRFDLAWDPSRETCDLTLREGSVEVRGMAGSGPLRMRAGQHFQGDARLGTMQVLALEPSLPLVSSASSALAPRHAPAPSAIAEALEPAEPVLR